MYTYLRIVTPPYYNMWLLSSRLIPHNPFKWFHIMEHSSGTFFRCTAFEAYSAEHSSPSSLRANQISAVGVIWQHYTILHHTTDSIYLFHMNHPFFFRFSFFISYFLLLLFFFCFEFHSYNFFLQCFISSDQTNTQMHTLTHTQTIQTKSNIY